MAGLLRESRSFIYLVGFQDSMGEDELHEAKHWKKEDESIRCMLCPKRCKIKPDGYGFCGVRKNIGNKLYSLVYNHPVSIHMDPIEKKPLFHFIPGTDILSVGTVGCNLGCLFCQNWEIARAKPHEIRTPKLTPEEVVGIAKQKGCRSIAYTYTEPTIAFEYVLDIAKLAHENGLKNIMVTNGFINEDPFNELYPYIDAANVDLKGFTEEFYRKITMSELQPVLETLKRIAKSNTWLEMTNLVIPGKNDCPEKIREMCKWIADNLGKDVPLHFSRFFPMYKMQDVPPTDEKKLYNAYKTAKDEGLNYVYIGNMPVEKEDSTFCPSCGRMLINRSGFGIVANNIREGKCKCGKTIPGIWE